MDNTFAGDEKLYRAVWPPSHARMYWKKDGSVSSAAFKDKRGLSVERGYHRDDTTVVETMKTFFSGIVIKVGVDDCHAVNALVLYLATERSRYHSEIHGSRDLVVLDSNQCKYLAEHCKVVGQL